MNSRTTKEPTPHAKGTGSGSIKPVDETLSGETGSMELLRKRGGSANTQTVGQSDLPQQPVSILTTEPGAINRDVPREPEKQP